MKILAVDTTASPVSAALVSDGVLTGEFYLNIRTTHSQTLMPLISALLETTKTNINDIDYFAVDTGPGSFTGVRIGTATVKGMAMPADKPCVSVSTLEAMAYGMPYTDGVVCAVMDARCSQVYNALFRIDNGIVERICEDRAVPIEALASELENFDDAVYLVGDGAELCMKSFGDRLANVILTPQNIRFQHAYGTAAAAAKKIASGDIMSAKALMPTYLRLPQAERERLAREKRN